MSDIPPRSLEQLLEDLTNLCTCGRGSNVDLCIYCDAHDQIQTQKRTLELAQTTLAHVPVLTNALNQVNNVIYGAGAPLGSEDYFKIRGICCDTLKAVGAKIDR